MKKIARLLSDIFVHNSLGWMLVVINLTALYFFRWYLEGGLHNEMAVGCVEGKFTLFSTYSYYLGGIFGVLSDITSNFIYLFNLPAISLSNFLSDILFSTYPQCYLTEGSLWSYSSYYIARICLSIFFIIIQWLIVAALARKLIKLVKDS